MTGDELVTISISCPTTGLAVSTRFSVMQAELCRIGTEEYFLEHMRMVMVRMQQAVREHIEKEVAK